MNTPTYSFYKLLPDGRYEFHVDASLLKDFSQCERYFYLKHVLNIRQKGHAIAKPFSMAIGSWWSDVMEEFYNALRDKRELTLAGVQEIALSNWAKGNLDASSVVEPDKFRAFGDLPGAVLMLNEYYTNQYLTDKMNWKIVSVEEGFGLKNEILLGENHKVVVYWVGKPDLTIIEGGRLQPVDHKTVTRIDGWTTSKYKPSSQMIGYVHACEVIAKILGADTRVDRCIVNICARDKPTDNPRGGKAKKPRFIRAYPNFTREEVAEWRRNVVARCERIAHCLITNDWIWKETTCHNFYMRPCDYLRLDSATPSARPVILQADYQEGVPWKPYDPKELDD